MRNNQLKSNINRFINETIRNKHPETVKQLVRLVQLKYPMPEQKIMEQILNLQNRGNLTLREYPALPPTLKGYFLSAKAAWYWIIVALAATTTALVFIIPEDAYSLIYARYVLGALFVLWLPGYTLIKALFPTKELDNIERTALSIGMSLALAPITGLLLSYTPWGMRTTPITLSLLALTLTLATAAIIREHQAQQ
jgi:hypothetical protein